MFCAGGKSPRFFPLQKNPNNVHILIGKKYLNLKLAQSELSRTEFSICSAEAGTVIRLLESLKTNDCTLKLNAFSVSI